MSYYVYFDKTLLPVAPQKLTMKIKNQNKTMNLINDGEVNIPTDAGLTDISFTALLPAAKAGYAVYTNGFIKPSDFLDVFKKLKTDKKPFQFIVTRTAPEGTFLFSTNITVTLESYTITEEASDGFDIKVAINLKQYREYGTKVYSVSGNTATLESSSRATKNPADNLPNTHTVISGDSLWNIAKTFYNDGNQYDKIYKANKYLIDKRNEDTSLSKYTIYTGQVLTIPV